jgi:spermidine synthase
VIPWALVDTAAIDDGGQLRLMQRGDEFSIRLGAIELMNSRVTGSEEALASLSCARIAHIHGPDILIGGLGMGFTLRAALAEIGPEARVIVAELVPAVVRWARGPLSRLFGACLSDPRVTIREADVVSLIRGNPEAYDAILLDVDNGPEGLTRESNDSLYDISGLTSGRQALRRGGVLAVWSSSPHKSFSSRLRKAGFEVDEISVRARGTRGQRYVVWIATKLG